MSASLGVCECECQCGREHERDCERESQCVGERVKLSLECASVNESVYFAFRSNFHTPPKSL